MPTRKYTYYDYTISLCPECLKRIDAKIVFEDEKVYMLKRCPEHGNSRVLIADDIPYYKNIRNYNKPSETPYKFNTKTHYGCPYDCGLCPDHEQHSCLTIIEITDRCNLTCPTCYAGSSPTYGRHRTLAEVKTMLDTIVANEKEPDVVQISGGEPTLHPQFFEILDYAKSLPIKHLMVNTNGLLIAKDFDFAKRLKSYAPDFEIYLQFDSFKEEALYQLRGANLKKIREKALEHLNELNLSTTLVVTLQKGLNDDEMGEIIDYALKQKCVRGVTFQPTQIAGRLDNFNHETDRITLTEVRRKILEQSTIFSPDDIIPVPCNPDALAMGYVLKLEGNNLPLTRYINPTDLLDNSKNTIVYEQDEALHQKMFEIFSTGTSTDKASDKLHQLLCCLPFVEAPNLGYDNLFRIIIMQFIDAHNFDVRAIKKSCVHIVNKDNTIIPFETMNLFYRDDKIERLKALQNETKL
ncbi:radical SAM protein [Paenimyroides aestuarii]|uniref:Radical SAM protein n=1 Tax=Paenimyroides aestuarii TaxID=2968490 RepID=A0ABY5NVY2_9FLAO|nr:radical SAM protein [Paenimyroides aestuarii]UUV22579.1 radical SAM protein [Paenimyroides aestuarii]